MHPLFSDSPSSAPASWLQENEIVMGDILGCPAGECDGRIRLICVSKGTSLLRGPQQPKLFIHRLHHHVCPQHWMVVARRLRWSRLEESSSHEKSYPSRTQQHPSSHLLIFRSVRISSLLLMRDTDAFHVVALQNGPTIVNCWVEAQRDDGVNLLSYYGRVWSYHPSDNTLLVNAPWFFAVGDVIRLYDGRLQPLGYATIAAMKVKCERKMSVKS